MDIKTWTAYQLLFSGNQAQARLAPICITLEAKTKELIDCTV